MNDRNSAYAREKTWIGHSSAIIQHLNFAASSIGSAVVTASFKSACPLLGFPDAESSSLALVFNEAPFEAGPGDRIEAKYNKDGMYFEFHSIIREVVSPRCWRLRLPNAISFVATRAAPRVKVSQDARFSVALSDRAPRLQLYDISKTGIALAYPPGREPPRPEAVLSGVLAVPDGVLIPVRLEVRHVRYSAGEDVHIAGCLITGISPPGRSLVLGVIDELTEGDGAHPAR